MAGLLYKDWLLLRRQLWYYALLLGLYLALTAAGVLDASFLCGLAVLYGTLLPTTCFSYDEAVHWERYAAATPAGRRGTVDGKYLLALLLAAPALAKVEAVDGCWPPSAAGFPSSSPPRWRGRRALWPWRCWSVPAWPWRSTPSTCPFSCCWG